MGRCETCDGSAGVVLEGRRGYRARVCEECASRFVDGGVWDCERVGAVVTDGGLARASSRGVVGGWG